jgi:GMP synthase (glutamine-hydrolysing)
MTTTDAGAAGGAAERPSDHGSIDTTTFDTVVVVDFGAQYAQLIARRVREAHVYSEIVPHTITAAELAAKKPAAVILSGGPKSVFVDGAPTLDAEIYDTGIPLFGICYGAQLIAQQLGGVVDASGRGEYGRTSLTVEPLNQGGRNAGGPAPSVLFDQVPPVFDVWMSHFNAVVRPPPGFRATASTPDAAVAALEDPVRKIYGVQFHPEVVHTHGGQEILKRFLYEVAGCRPTWTITSVIDAAVEAIRAQVGTEGVICGLSGGVDSAVAAALVHRAVGDQLTCVFVDRPIASG